MAASKILIFDVQGMTCDNCVHHVTEAVQHTAGVTKVKVDLLSNSAKVEGDFDIQQVIAAIEQEGYEAAVRA
jgi:copper chaperone CopZ